MKKNLKTLTTDLAGLARSLPTQHVKEPDVPAPAAVVEQAKPARKPKPKKAPAEPEVQFNFGMPQSVRKALAIKALEADMTMRGYILAALREKGIEVDDAVIADARRKG